MTHYWLTKAILAMPDFTFCIHGEIVSVSHNDHTRCFHKSILCEPFPALVIGSHFL